MIKALMSCAISRPAFYGDVIRNSIVITVIQCLQNPMLAAHITEINE